MIFQKRTTISKIEFIPFSWNFEIGCCIGNQGKARGSNQLHVIEQQPWSYFTISPTTAFCQTPKGSTRERCNNNNNSNNNNLPWRKELDEYSLSVCNRIVVIWGEGRNCCGDSGCS
jgi:hypothetical protein